MSALCLTVINFYTTFNTPGNELISKYIPELFSAGDFTISDATLPPITAWVIIVVFMFTIPPMILLKFGFKESLLQYHKNNPIKNILLIVICLIYTP